MSFNNESQWDPSRLKLDTAVAQHTKTPSRRKLQAKRKTNKLFLCGPVPMDWLNEAAKLGVSALWVGNVLWHLAGLKKSRTFLVSNEQLYRWGIERRAKSRALKALSNAGLIAVERRGKRSPKVTILVSSNEGTNTNDGDKNSGAFCRGSFLEGL